jgi:hypothetical protein
MAHGERDAVGDSGGDDSGECGDAFTRGAEKLPGALGGVTVELRVDCHHDDSSRAKADVDLRGTFQAPEKESGSAEQDERHRDLRDDEKAAQAPAAARASEGLFAFERVGHSGARGTPCRSEAADKTSEEAEEEGVEKDAPVDVDGDIYRDGDGQAEGGERIGGPYGEKDPDGASREGKKDALEKELAEKLRACGSERDSHRHLTLTLRSLREEKIGDARRE